MLRSLAVVLSTIGILFATIPAVVAAAPTSAGVTLFATGLDNPRGLTFGPDGFLYVAEGGTGGSTTTTASQCTQVPDAGPYSGGFTARISKISPAGVVSTVLDGLPSSQTNPGLGSLVSGVADVKFVGHTLYALEAGAGCSHGLIGTTNGIYRVNANAPSWSLVADLSAFLKAHPVAHPNPGDFEPDGTWYSMVAVRRSLYAVEPNHGEVDRITTGGAISRVADISASQGHIVPTAIGYHGNFFVGNLNTFPIQPGSSKILKLTPSGQVKTWASGLTTVLGVAFDHWGRLYALENTTCNAPCFPTPFTGAIVRLNGDGSWSSVASGLMFPTAMTFGLDGNLYVSTFGFGGPAGAGTIVRVNLAG